MGSIDEKLKTIARLTDYSEETVRKCLFADLDEHHQRWIEESPLGYLVAWVLCLERLGQFRWDNLGY